MSIDLSLDRIRKLQEHLPKYTRPTCHIAGTNGKGSVSALLTSIFRAASPPFKVGRFNSPHLVSVCDCITIDNEPVSTDTYSETRSRVEHADRDNNIGASNFEILTMTALLILEDAAVDVSVIEVGMGGGLDATNAIPDDCIVVSGLTAVDLDHQAFLGDTILEIAREKAAICRAGKPFVVGPQRYPEVMGIVQETVTAAGGELLKASTPDIRDWNEAIDGPAPSISSLLPTTFQKPPPQPVTIGLACFPQPLQLLLPLQGKHQLANLGTALSMVSALLSHPASAERISTSLPNRLNPAAIRRGVSAVNWPGRLSFHKITLPLHKRDLNQEESLAAEELLVLVDGAHNPASAETLATYIDELLSQVLSSTPDQLTSVTQSGRRRITLTYLLALSHSPPKTPIQTLTPLLPPHIPKGRSKVDININVGLLRFTPPEGMPWVKSVPPAELRGVVSSLVPDANIWSPKDEDTLDSQLTEALEWAYGRQEDNTGHLGEGLVVVAGSLYLVADFYRLLGVAF
ncbi:unnamed protein product [Somion occarium]|uniref:Mur ligase central domain-containing protein n=1 Tax=Somion occarium TaxID=3059160 RepID=A0ABP1DXM5_9APHY